MEPKVTLISHTKDPIGTIFTLWEASKSNRPMEQIEATLREAKRDPETDEAVMDVFRKVIDSGIPVAENLNFVFLLENVSISFREQMVRHRIGVKVGDRLGVDMVPGLHDSTWWSQSMRILDMGRFYDDQAYRLPEAIKSKRCTTDNGDYVPAEQVYRHAMATAATAYQLLVEAGVPMEEAREVIPLAVTHRISWGLNLAALQHIIGKRGCQILQLGLWEPIIRGMVEELATKVHPYFRNLIAPPCIKGDKFVGCCFKFDNERRVKGEDNLPPCTLYIGKEESGGLTVGDWGRKDPRFFQAGKDYGALWGRDPYTGTRP